MTIYNMSKRSGIKPDLIRKRLKSIYPDTEKFIKNYEYSEKDYETIKEPKNFKWLDSHNCIFIGEK